MTRWLCTQVTAWVVHAERARRHLLRALASGWAYRQFFTTNDQRAAALAPWLAQYNTRGRHTALGGLPPVSRQSST